jgi:hypothetical protein
MSQDEPILEYKYGPLSDDKYPYKRHIEKRKGPHKDREWNYEAIYHGTPGALSLEEARRDPSLRPLVGMWSN